MTPPWIPIPKNGWKDITYEGACWIRTVSGAIELTEFVPAEAGGCPRRPNTPRGGYFHPNDITHFLPIKLPDPPPLPDPYLAEYSISPTCRVCGGSKRVAVENSIVTRCWCGQCGILYNTEPNPRAGEGQPRMHTPAKEQKALSDFIDLLQLLQRRIEAGEVSLRVGSNYQLDWGDSSTECLDPKQWHPGPIKKPEVVTITSRFVAKMNETEETAND